MFTWTLPLILACSGKGDDSASSASCTPSTWFEDSDGDGFGNVDVSASECDAPSGFVSNANDCDDSSAGANPDGVEECDGLDNDCDGEVDAGATSLPVFYEDADQDGYGNGSVFQHACEAPPNHVENAGDCDDTSPEIAPKAGEVCDGVDNDCDGLLDDGDPDVTGLLTFYADNDYDGYGGDTFVEACSEGVGAVSEAGDCDDTNVFVNPGAVEVCDKIDNNCDSLIDIDDPTVADAVTYYFDDDSDTYGSPLVTTIACAAPKGYVDNDIDCNDFNALVNPKGVEECDWLDNDCNGLVDDAAKDLLTDYYRDDDGDGWGAGKAVPACFPSGFYTAAAAGDCDDTRWQVNPGYSEVCDGLDNDCNKLVDEDDKGVVLDVWYDDVDGDTYGDDDATSESCSQPKGTVNRGGDCNDDDSDVRPLATEWCDKLDNDCDSSVDEDVEYRTYYPDEDGDGYGSDADEFEECLPEVDGYIEIPGDCDDDDDGVNPDADDTPYDGYDDDCDYWDDYDADLDGYASQDYGGDDCDDDDPTVHPYAFENLTDKVDNDCDGEVDGKDTDPRTSITLSDDDYSTEAIGFTFEFCGTDYTDVHVSSNGHVTFDYGSTSTSTSTSSFRSDEAIAVYWADLNPNDGGAVWVIEYDNKATGIYWVDVPSYGDSTERHDIGVILHEDGTVRIDLARADKSGAMMGWSCGTGVGVQTDLSAERVAIPADSLGIGQGTEDSLYEYFSVGHDLIESTYPFCVNAGDDADGDEWTDECGDSDDTDDSVHP